VKATTGNEKTTAVARSGEEYSTTEII